MVVEEMDFLAVIAYFVERLERFLLRGDRNALQVIVSVCRLYHVYLHGFRVGIDDLTLVNDRCEEFSHVSLTQVAFRYVLWIDSLTKDVEAATQKI